MHGAGGINLGGTVVRYPTERDRRHAAKAVYGDRADGVLARIAARQVAANKPELTDGETDPQNACAFCGGEEPPRWTISSTMLLGR